MTILAAMAGGAVPAKTEEGGPLFSTEVLRTTAAWLRTFALAWHSEIPQRIHKAEIDQGGAPEFHNDFTSWIERPCNPRKFSCRNTACAIVGQHPCHDLHCTHATDRIVDARHRTHRSFRKLRRVAPREFDAVYLLCAKNLSFEETAHAMTDRAIRLNKPERYTATGVLVLAVSAVDKLSRWY